MMRVIWAWLVILVTAQAAWAQTAPPKQPPTWGQEPVETLSATRARVCLNGLWRFVPARGADAQTPNDWGLMPVPGSWATPPSGGVYSLPFVAGRGKGAVWQGLAAKQTGDDWNALDRAWYERPLPVPPNWAGRQITLNFARVSTDAQVYVNGTDCGRVAWPGGSIDIGRAVTPGQPATLRALVVASKDKNVETVFMGTAQGQTETRAATLESRGIIDDVFLESAPRGPRVSDVFVQPSVRKKTLTLDVELENVAHAGQVTLSARCLDSTGAEAKSFLAQTVPAQSGTHVVQLTLPWPDPRLWDLDSPNLYTLVLKADGAGMSDEYAQSFGFREFWIEGRQIFLNGTPFRMRPTVLGNSNDHDATMPEIDDSMIDGFRRAGFNIQEFWPWDQSGRGTVHFHDLYYERADRKGWPVIGSLSSMANTVDRWDQPGVKEDWTQRVRREIRQGRNHPSVVMWIHSANRFGNWDDQNPRRVGNQAKLAAVPDRQETRTRVGLEADAIIHGLDPTRAVSTHQGGAVGDWHTANNYLNFTPYQEQEEWLSDWVGTGDRPYMPVEFGYILGCDFKRGRMPGAWGRGQGAVYSEHWTTERVAQFYGDEAYLQEPAAAREIHAKQFMGDVTVDVLGKPLSPQFKKQYYKERPGYAKSELTDALFALHYHDVYRSWRTMGETGGAIPWDYGDGWPRVNTPEPLGPFVPGRRGVYTPTVPAWKLHFMQPGGSNINVVGQGLSSSLQPTLAWICGGAEPDDRAAFTSKDHNYKSGGALKKQIALLNDTRAPQDYAVTWAVRVGGKSVATKTTKGRLAIAQTLFVPIDAALPTVGVKTEGQITLSATIGGVAHTDAFDFRVFPPLKSAPRPVLVWDPAGKSTALLRALGCTAKSWDGKPSNTLLVIGREALSGGATPPGDLNAFVAGGGRVLVLEQTPEWLRSRGFRVGAQVRREAFAVSPGHPVMAGLDARDLANWAGSSTLTDPRPVITEKDRSATGYPKHGWHWGNRGGVSSAPIEKPHRSSWRSLLENDFDLAYSPLLAMEQGKGRVVLCELDLEDHFARDAGAARLAANVLQYATTPVSAPKVTRVLYLGDDAGAAKLTAMGVQFERTDALPKTAALLILGHNWARLKGGLENFDAFMAAGGQELMLADTAEYKPGLKHVTGFSGSLRVPDWDECRGLSPSDLRWRAPHDADLLDAAQLAPGVALGADGLLSRTAHGPGLVVSCQIDPDGFDADNLTYFRFTRWRQTRALSQILSNMGASFAGDTRLFDASVPSVTRLPLDGQWKVASTLMLPSAPSMAQPTTDPGPSAAARAAVALGFSDGALSPVTLPGDLPAFDKSDGEAVFRRVVDVPTDWAGKDLRLTLGPIDDYDNTFFNGVEVGHVGAETVNPYSAERVYTVPGRLVRAGRNVLAVRVFDRFGNGGFAAGAGRMALELPAPAGAGAGSLYHPDYRADYALGDAPHRYYRW